MFSEPSRVLDGLLNDFAQANSVSVAWENFKFNPDPDELYLRASNIPSDTIGLGLSGDSANSSLGVYQVDILALPDKGKKQGLDMVDLLANKFKRGIHEYNGFAIQIRKASRSPARNQDDRYIISLSIYYQSLT